MTQQNLEKIRTISKDLSFPINKLQVFKIAVKAFFFINGWSSKFKITLSTGFRLKLSTFIGIVLQQYYSYEAMTIFFRGISIQRYWDNLYDDNSISSEALKVLRKKITLISEENRDPLLSAHDTFMADLSRMTSNDYLKTLVGELDQELLKVLDAYEFERELSTMERKLTLKDLEEYKLHSTNSVALKYTFYLLGISLIRNEDEYREFQEAFILSNEAAWSIRLANDIEGHQRELLEGKKDYITLVSNVRNESEEEIIKSLLDEIALITKRISTLNDSKFNVLLKRITFLAVARYLNNNF